MRKLHLVVQVQVSFCVREWLNGQVSLRVGEGASVEVHLYVLEGMCVNSRGGSGLIS